MPYAVVELMKGAESMGTDGAGRRLLVRRDDRDRARSQPFSDRLADPLQRGALVAAVRAGEPRVVTACVPA
mgnify:CR=1 FL=1